MEVVQTSDNNALMIMAEVWVKAVIKPAPITTGMALLYVGWSLSNVGLTLAVGTITKIVIR